MLEEVNGEKKNGYFFFISLKTGYVKGDDPRKDEMLVMAETSASRTDAFVLDDKLANVG